MELNVSQRTDLVKQDRDVVTEKSGVTDDEFQQVVDSSSKMFWDRPWHERFCLVQALRRFNLLPRRLGVA